MSTLALMLAVRDELRAVPDLGLDASSCQITHRGQPFAYAGEKFVGVWYGYWRDNASNGQSLDTRHGVNVTVSLRAPVIPRDKIGPELIAKLTTGLLALCERVVAVIHMDPRNVTEGAGGLAYSAVLKRANEIIGREANGFVEPLQFVDGGQPEDKPGSWWYAKGEPLAGLAQTVSFGNANRVQVIEEMT